MLIDRITLALTSLDAVFADMPGPGAPTDTRLRIGCLPIVSATFLPTLLGDWSALRGQARVEVLSGSKLSLLKRLREGEIDLMLGRLPAPEDLDGLQFEELFVDTYVFVARPGHPLAGASGLDTVVDSGMTILMPTEETVTWSEIARFFRSQGMPLPRSRIETIYLNLSQRLAERSDCIWIASDFFVRDLVEAGRLVRLPIVTEMLKAPIGIITRAGQGRGTTLREFVRLAKKLAATPAFRTAREPRAPGTAAEDRGTTKDRKQGRT